MREECGTACYDKYGKDTCGTDHLGLIDLGVLEADTLFDKLNAERGKVVEAFAHRLKHDKAERDAHDRINHAESLA